MPEEEKRPGIIESIPGWMALIALLAVVTFIYWPVRHGAWLWDDNTEITRNLDLRGPDALWKIWFAPAAPDYFPLKTTLQYCLWLFLGDGSTIGYHSVNIVLHVLAAWLVGKVFLRLGLKNAWWGAVLFAVHPLAVESVAWIAEMKNMLSLVFLLLALLAYLDWEERGGRVNLIRSLLCYLAAMLSKSTVVMFPVFLVLLAWWKDGRLERRAVKSIGLFFVISLVLGLVTLRMQTSRAVAGWELPVAGLGAQIAGAGRAVLFYINKMVLPWDLSPVYPGWTGVELAAGALAWPALALVGGLAWWTRGTGGRHWLLALGWFVLNLVPVLGFLPMSYAKISPVADHFAYLSLVGGAGLFALGLDSLQLVGSKLRIRLVVPLAATICLASLVSSRVYAGVFASPESMWRQALRRNPSAWIAHSNLATLLLDRQRTVEAGQHAALAVQINPRFAPARVVLGNALAQAGKSDDAIAQYRVALELEADNFEAHYNLANALAQTGQLAAAVAEYETALRISPAAGDAHFNLANTFVSLNRLQDALHHYSAALEANPHALGALVNRGNVHAALGQWPEAIADFKAARAVQADSADVAWALADALAESGSVAESLQFYAEALDHDGKNPDLHRAYANALSRAGRREDAERELRLADSLRR